MELLTHYQNELLGLLSLFLILSIFLIIKRKKTITQDSQTDDKEEVQTTSSHPSDIEEESTDKEDSPESPLTHSDIQKEEKVPDSLEGKEEGDFGVTEHNTEKEVSSSNFKQAYKKRDVPPHQKITKDDFKEFEGTRILIAEDNLINQKVIKGLLAESGIEIVMADDGIEALEILEHDDNFSLILMDAHMPRLDGFETTRKIRMNPAYAHIAVIALSGDTAADDIKKMKEAGMVEHLEKPLKMDALYDVLYAYTKNEDTNTINTSLDTEEGLYICGEDESFYKDILQEFINNYQNSDKTLNDLLSNNKLAEADQLLLDIIGVAANIGATQLTNIAQQLKNSLNEKEKAILLLQNYSTELATLIHTITTYLQDK